MSKKPPYSAYITIRKKFIKGSESNAEPKSLSSNREDREVIKNHKAKIEALEIDNANFESDLHSLSLKKETVSNELVRVMAEKVAVEPMLLLKRPCETQDYLKYARWIRHFKPGLIDPFKPGLICYFKPGVIKPKFSVFL